MNCGIIYESITLPYSPPRTIDKIQMYNTVKNQTSLTQEHGTIPGNTTKYRFATRKVFTAFRTPTQWDDTGTRHNRDWQPSNNNRTLTPFTVNFLTGIATWASYLLSKKEDFPIHSPMRILCTN